MNILDEIGDFTHIGFRLFFVETKRGNFVWDEMTGTLTLFGGSYFCYMDRNKVMKVKFKGKHKIRDYCGSVKVVADGYF
jgi:hypothetical protein